MERQIATIHACHSDGPIATYRIHAGARLAVERCWGYVTLADGDDRRGTFHTVHRQARGNPLDPWKDVALVAAVVTDREARDRAELEQLAEAGKVECVNA